MRTIIVNCKNYPEVLGEGSIRMALAVKKAGEEFGVEAIVAPPTPYLAMVAAKTRAIVYGQGVGNESGDRTTGAVLPEAIKAAGARGTLLNHSESRRPISEISMLVPRLTGLGLGVCLCAQTNQEAGELARLKPTYVAVEPPELIGSGVAVSKARPELVESTVKSVRDAGFNGRILCGAGIVSGDDVKAAVKLGTDGVLVASSIVKSSDWDSKVRELAGSLI